MSPFLLPGTYRGLLAVFAVLFLLLQTACSDSSLDPKHPVTLTMWHVYGAQTSSPMNALVERFNLTEGRKHGVIISVTSVSNSTAIHGALVDAAHARPGAGELPDLCICYPKTLIAMGSDLALDWNSVFSEKELEAYVPQFLEEGRIEGKLKVFPVAKSTNTLFLNAALFEPFARECGVTYADLDTWEGLFHAAKLYYTWSHGKPFFMYDDWLHYAMLNTEALGDRFFEDGHINWDSPALHRVWHALAEAALNGEVCLMTGYSTKAMMTGEAVCGVESSAGVLYFKDTVTLKDNSTIPLRLTALPVPRFKGAKRLDLQRGCGLCALNTTPQKKAAAALFCKWLTTPENNLSFVIEGGYIPVRKESYRKLAEEKDNLPFRNERYRILYAMLTKLYAKTSFYTPPVFEGYGRVEYGFADTLRAVFAEYRTKLAGKEDSLDNLVEQTFTQMKQRVTALQGS